MKQLLKLYLPLLFAATIGIACSGDDDDGGQAMSAFLDVLSRSAGSLADGNDVAECDDA